MPVKMDQVFDCINGLLEKTMLHYYLGRQPIFDGQLNLNAYELLYRSGEMNSAHPSDGDVATSNVLLNAFMEMGFDKVVGEHRAFVNLTRKFIVEDGILPPSSKQLVLEILEDQRVDKELLDGVMRLRNQGYIIALDDFVFEEQYRSLIELADIIKIDLRALTQKEVLEHVALLRQYPVKLLAEKVETPEEFEWCRECGFDLFQGYFLCKPKVLKGRRMPANRLNTMRMLAKLQETGVEIKELEGIVSEDVTMSYKLLRYINSAAFSLGKKIESIRHAIVYLGLREVKHWASMIAISSLDDKPEELMTTSLVRAKMCELLCDFSGQGNRGTAFMVGLFSCLDAMMDQPLEILLEELPLSDEIKNALLHQTGAYADMLHNTLSYERGDWGDLECQSIDENDISEIYLQAIDWTNQTMRSMQAAA